MPEDTDAIIPIIKVEISDFGYNVQSIAELLYQNNIEKNKSIAFKDRIFYRFPDIKDRYSEDMSDQEIDQVVEQVLRTEYERNLIEMEVRRKELQEKLKLFLIPAFLKMHELFEINWIEKMEITCYLGLYTVFPRNVITREYWVHYLAPDEVIMKASVHEINHIILFEKWKSMHGYTKAIEPVHPEPLWWLEEMAVDPTLNHPEMLKVSPYQQKAYQSFYDNKINGVALEEYIIQIFDERVDMADFLDKAYNFIESNIADIISMCG